MRPRLIVALLMLAGQTAAARAASPVPHHMPVVVQADRIVIATDVVPRYLDLPRVLTVPRGTTFTAPPDSTWDYIEVSGTLRISRTQDTVLRFTHLFVLPGGTLDVGTQASPIPPNVRVEFVVRDVPIDTERDPFQWGNGLLNFGRQSRVGAAKAAWTPLAGDVLAAADTVTLAADPIGWQIGDELLIPDTRQTALPARPRREASVTIAGIAGRTITLSKPLDFEHLAIRDPEGAIVLSPRVANLTRNIVIRSEAPDGTPGHTANIGKGATWDIRYNEFVGLGRTRAIPQDNTNLATAHVGSNQLGRYNDHHHHAQGLGSRTVGNAYRGSGRGKWGLVVHGTHDELIEDNVAVGFPGADFVTEDGYEVRNVFRRNFAAYSIGNHNAELSIEVMNAAKNPGAAGNGFWARGVMNTFEGNEAWNNAIGFNMFNQDHVLGSSPSAPGGDPDTPLNRHIAIPVRFADNVTAANGFTGLEYWAVPRFPAINHTSAFNGAAQFVQTASNLAAPYFVNPTFVGDRGTGIGIVANAAYVSSVTIEGGRIVGHAEGMHNAAETVRITGTKFQNVMNLAFFDFPTYSSYENVLHVKMPGLPALFMQFGDGQVWDGTSARPVGDYDRTWLSPRGSAHKIINWQGTGQNFRILTRQSLASLPAYPSYNRYPFVFACPDAGLTQGQCWSKYGLAYGGEPAAEADLVPLEGVTNGLVLAGLAPVLGPPRCVITNPTNREAARVADGSITVFARHAGDYTAASDKCRVSVDGGEPFLVGPPESGAKDGRTFTIKQVAPGPHEIRTWRTDARLKPIESSLMTFHYLVGAAITTPPQNR